MWPEHKTLENAMSVLTLFDGRMIKYGDGMVGAGGGPPACSISPEMLPERL